MVEVERKNLFERLISRRKFFDVTVSGGFALTAAVIFLPLLRFLYPPTKKIAGSTEAVPTFKTDEIPEGQARSIIYNNEPTLIVHYKDSFFALSAVCTHAGCVVKWDEKKRMISCPCHGASFDVKGKVLEGPPPAPLKVYSVKISGDTVFVKGS